jgi:hypothetical protein
VVRDAIIATDFASSPEYRNSQKSSKNRGKPLYGVGLHKSWTFMMLDAGRLMLVDGIALLYLFNNIGSIPCLSSIQ